MDDILTRLEEGKILQEYRDNPIFFFEDNFNLDWQWSEQQLQIINSVVDNKRISAKSGHGIGKSTTIAALVWWFLCCFHKPQIAITGPNTNVVFDALWSRISELFEKLNPVFSSNFIVTDKRIYHKNYKNQWFAKAKVSKKEEAEGMQGLHADNLMYVIDEASGVHVNIFDTIYGSLTGRNNYCIMIGNPLRLSGEFYDSFSKNIDLWKTFTFNSEDSPVVSKEFIKTSFIRGNKDKDSNYYRVRVLGKFPKSESDTLIPLDSIEDAATRNIINPSGSIVWACDPARFGSDSSILIKRQERKLYNIKKWKNIDTMQLAGQISHEYNHTENEGKPEKIFVDVIGIGSGVYDRLNELGLPVVPVNVAEKSNDPKKYKNIRSECYDSLTMWFLEDEPDIPDDDQLIRQCSTLKYKFASNGSMQIQEKEQYKKENPSIGSPDIADALAISFFKRITTQLNIIWV